jgi:hypothetical protein
LRISWVWASGTKLARIRPCANSSASHIASFTSASGGSEGGADGAGATAGAGGCGGVDGLCTGARFASLMARSGPIIDGCCSGAPSLGVAPSHIGSVE